eukprot:gb/GECG01003696.1/.p1 GENE.gb/GECG01003696.1/~~gb/GECG01003696.1/.p1  ORF type:complete len:428 (+),score=44.64 gb/GECG01003696.1/:1-1284(+)
MEFSIMQYNALAQRLVSSKILPYVKPRHVLKLKHRAEMLKTELSRWNTDIMCIVEADCLDRIYGPWFQENGYDFCYATRPNKTDCALIAWKKDKFELVSGASLCFDDLADAVQQYMESGGASQFDGQPEHEEDSVQAHFCKNNVAAMVALRGKGDDSDKGLIVGSTHLYFNPALANVKLSQAQMLKEALGYFGNKHSYPVVLCSDLNSQPTGVAYSVLTFPANPVYSTSHKVSAGWARPLYFFEDENTAYPVNEFNPSNEDRQNWLEHLQQLLHVGTEKSLLVSRDTAECWNHKVFDAMKEASSVREVPWSFTSAYKFAAENNKWLDSPEGYGSNVDSTTQEPEATTWTADFSGCIDYIFFRQASQSSSRDDHCEHYSPVLKLLGCQPLPTRDEACADADCLALPNGSHPSDHLPLVAKFSLENSTE